MPAKTQRRAALAQRGASAPRSRPARRPSTGTARPEGGRPRPRAARPPGRARSSPSRGRPAPGRGRGRARSADSVGGVGESGGVDEGRVLDLGDPRAPGARRRTPSVRLAAHRHDGGRVGEGVTLEDLGGPEERAAGRKARVAELIGDRGVHVHDQGHSEEPRERRRQVGRLLHGVDHVVAVASPSGQAASTMNGTSRSSFASEGPAFTRPTGRRRLRRWTSPGTSTGVPWG